MSLTTEYGKLCDDAEELLANARRSDDVIICAGEYDNTYYFSAPAKKIKCDVNTLYQLALDLDSVNERFTGGLCINQLSEYRETPVYLVFTDDYTTTIKYGPRICDMNLHDEVCSVLEGNLARLEVDIESIQHRADGGDVYALYQMAEHIYDRQIKTNHRPDYFVRTLSYYRQAAKKGHLQSQYFLSLTSLVPPKENLKWLEIISKGPDDDKRIHFSKAFLADEYIKMDSTKQIEAVSMLQTLANRYSGPAFKLAVQSLKGQGTPKDNVQGLTWLLIAERLKSMEHELLQLFVPGIMRMRSGNAWQCKQLKQILYKHLTPEEMHKAEEAASNWEYQTY
ncbi:MAG: hypothetical protein IPP57_11040 [Candidatus Obscuribacter sp.]|jgi:TPR repeat protein|nr:hypothetical protein [Candidatus Obscuribacter sp.]MBK9620887.1 hypothetical protein [Candidatus Obscuribacter sp.]MBK9771344.1 hypothetical protein [Candidatus Obscuribacter sp.]